MIAEDRKGVLRRDYRTSFCYVRASKRILVLDKNGLSEILLLNFLQIVNRLERDREWKLAFSFLNRIYLKEESRFKYPPNLNLKAIFTDLLDSYLSFGIGKLAKKANLWIDCICSASYFSKTYGLQSEVLLKIKELSIQHNIIQVYFDCVVCLIGDGVIKKLDIDELRLLVEYLKLEAGQNLGPESKNSLNFEKICTVLMNLDLDGEKQKNFVVSLCYELGLLKPLVTIFVGDVLSPDYFSCLNILMTHFQQSQNSEKSQMEPILKQIIDLIQNGISRIKSTKKELKLTHLTKKMFLQVKVKILDQLLLWLLDAQIISTLLTHIPRSIFNVLEKFFSLEVYEVLTLSKIDLFKGISNIYGYPNHLYSEIKSTTFKFIAE
jgi:hypothetical protein